MQLCIPLQWQTKHTVFRDRPFPIIVVNKSTRRVSLYINLIGINVIIIIIILVVAFIVPLIIMIIAYVKVGVSLHRSVKKAKSISSCHEEKLKTDNLSSRIKVLFILHL